MTLIDFYPSAFLAPYVQVYRIIGSAAGSINRVLPAPSLAMAFCLRGKIAYQKDETQVSLPETFISGLQKSVRLIQYHPNSRALIIIFRPGGAAAFLRLPLHELYEASVPLDHFFPAIETSLLEEQLDRVEDDGLKINMVEDFLLKKLRGSRPDPLIKEAIFRIEQNKGVLRISDLCKSLFISQDAFEKRFRKITGTSPKQFCMIVRMKNITQQTGMFSLMDLAIENGYHDQSHFTKDFKTYTGLSPGEFFKSPRPW